MATDFDTRRCARRSAPAVLRPRALTRGDTILALVPVSTTQGRAGGGRRPPSHWRSRPLRLRSRARKRSTTRPRRPTGRRRASDGAEGAEAAAAARSPARRPTSLSRPTRLRSSLRRKRRKDGPAAGQRASARRTAHRRARAAPAGAAARAAAAGEARAPDLGRRRRAACRAARGRPRRRGLPRAAGAALDRRQHLPRHRRQRPPGDGVRVRRDRPRAERLPVRRRDRRPRARGQAPRQEDHRPDPARAADPRPGGQGSDEDEGRPADDGDLAAGPLPRLRPERRGPRRLPAARGRRAPAAEGHPQGDRAVTTGGVIVRTAAEGASAEDIERDLVFLQRLWKTIQARANSATRTRPRLPGGRASASDRA